jgi:1-acyl-sn-glycerol-3-phosphate acyltransferase
LQYEYLGDIVICKMLFIRSTIFNSVFYAWTVVSLIVQLPLLLLPRRYLFNAAGRWARQVNWLMKKITNTEIEIRGLEHLPEVPCIIASKHQSVWESINCLNAATPPAIVLKSELTWLPIFGQMCVKSQMISVHRRGGIVAIRGMIADGKQAISQNRNIVIFPQGTRTAPTEGMDKKPYLNGVAALYTSLNVPVIPVALNSGIYWPRRRWVHYPGKIILEYLKPIEPGLSRRDFTRLLAQSIETRTESLVKEGLSKLPNNSAAVQSGSGLNDEGG